MNCPAFWRSLFLGGLVAALGPAILAATAPGLGQTFFVTQTGEEGPGSLRQAILDANDHPGKDAILFRIERGAPDPATGAYTIPELRPGDSATIPLLPEVTDPVVIDGYSQPGASRAAGGQAGRLLIEISRTGLRFSATSSGSVLRGLVINQSPGLGVLMRGASNVIEGNYIGTDVTGTKAKGNTGTGVALDPSHGNLVRDNLLSANGGAGLVLNEHGQPLGYDVVIGNKIGTDVTGTLPLGNQRLGMLVWTHHNRIENNLIAFNGTEEQKAHGLIIDNSYGNARFNVVRHNRISDHDGDGIGIRGGSRGNTFSENRIFNNGGLGIDLGSDGLTLNDAGDQDAGENDRQNFPVLDRARSGPRDGAFVVAGGLESEPESDYRIELFANDPGETTCLGLASPVIWLTEDARVRNLALGRTISIGDYGVEQARADFRDPGDRRVMAGRASSVVFHLGGGGGLLFQSNPAVRSLFPIAQAEPGKPADNFITAVEGRFAVHPDANRNGMEGETILVTWGLFSDDGAVLVLKGGPSFQPDPDNVDPGLQSVYREHDGIGANYYSPAYRLTRLQEGATYEFELHHFEAGGGEGLTVAYGLGDQRDKAAALAPLATRDIVETFRHHSPECGAQSFNAAEGRHFLASFRVRTDAQGRASFAHPLAGSARPAGSVTATATRLVDGQPEGTSEFSEALSIR